MLAGIVDPASAEEGTPEPGVLPAGFAMACDNAAADWTLLLELMTANAIRQLFDDGDRSPRLLFSLDGRPIPGVEPAARLTLAGVHDVQLLPDGRALAAGRRDRTLGFVGYRLDLPKAAPLISG